MVEKKEKGTCVPRPLMMMTCGYFFFLLLTHFLSRFPSLFFCTYSTYPHLLLFPLFHCTSWPSSSIGARSSFVPSVLPSSLTLFLSHEDIRCQFWRDKSLHRIAFLAFMLIYWRRRNLSKTTNLVRVPIPR